MDEVRIKILKVIGKAPHCRLTIPKEVIESLGIRGGEKVEVSMDTKRRRIVYQIISS